MRTMLRRLLRNPVSTLQVPSFSAIRRVPPPPSTGTLTHTHRLEQSTPLTNGAEAESVFSQRQSYKLASGENYDPDRDVVTHHATGHGSERPARPKQHESDNQRRGEAKLYAHQGPDSACRREDAGRWLQS